MEKCPECNGSGVCSLCDGTGRIKINPHPSPRYTSADGSGTSICYLCDGTGKCPDCNGTGRKD